MFFYLPIIVENQPAMDKPDPKKIYEYKIFKFIAALSTIFVGAFFIFYDETDLFMFPFDSNVWGTASDWVVIFVTALTAWFLWSTLRSQQDIQELQTNLNRLQFKQHLKNIRPYFIIHDEIRKTQSSSRNYKTIRVNGSNAHNIKISNIYNNLDVKDFIPFVAVETNLNIEFITTSGVGGDGYISSGYSLGSVSNRTGENKEVKLLSFSYDDEEQNPYKQILYYKTGQLLFTKPTSN